MQITLRDLSDNLITDFNYHDALIINITKVNNNVTILLKDGFNKAWPLPPWPGWTASTASWPPRWAPS